MILNNPYHQYQQNSIMTASPGDLILMLYDGAIKFIKQAKVYIDEKDMQKANNAILKAEDIVAELMADLDPAYDISHDLYSLYEFINDCLVRANIKKDKVLLDQSLDLISDMRQTWAQVVKQYRQQEYAGI
ncbi:flagellar export chaperone FliS [Mahella australiensis]|uniref:Flagellar secretion chaperone FliS n=1 Tax=Mahella australiensis (strain DSM 15567 / CIP 107919 / 50-1 BON) TaxID=697281 RepID=F3ZZ82_MAHA5|nr:flagellar export chaperone FliS [Mahella australiensis]AEE97864.1 flagellar protein FliS [Mahella australiensis 50-1 BON]